MVFVEPVTVMLPTLITSILLSEPTIIAELVVSVPGTWSSISVKYLPPITR